MAIPATIQINMYFCTMTTNKKEERSFLGSIERGVALVFIVLFLFWFARRCARSAQMTPQQPIEQTQNVDTTRTANNSQPVTKQPVTTVRVDTIIKTVSTPPVVYVYTEGLKLRAEPYLNKPVIAELPTNATLTYLSEKTAFAQKITLDNVAYNEPWIKVRTTDNKEGWVYGGGVRFYKK